MTIAHDGKTFVTGTRKPSLPKLVVTKGKNEGKEYWIKGEETSIGRSPECDITISDNNISRKHTRVVFISGIFFVYDNESLNGTLLNGKKIIEAQIKTGDLIRIGETEFKFEYEKDAKGPDHQKTIPLFKAPPKDEAKPVDLKNSPLDKRFILYLAASVIVLFTLLISFYAKKHSSDDTVTSTPTPKFVFTQQPNVINSPNPTATETPGASATGSQKETDPTKYYSQGLLAMMSNNYKEAITSFAKVLEIDPEHESAKIKIEKCKEELKKSIGEFYAEGIREYDILRYDRAILEWTKVMTLAKDFDPGMYQKASDRIEEAEKRRASLKN